MFSLVNGSDKQTDASHPFSNALGHHSKEVSSRIGKYFNQYIRRDLIWKWFP